MSNRGGPEGDFVLLNYAKQSIDAVHWAGRIEELIRIAIGRCPATEFQSPQLINLDRLPSFALHRPHQRSRVPVKAVDGPGIGIVPDQQRAAERADERADERAATSSAGMAIAPGRVLGSLARWTTERASTSVIGSPALRRSASAATVILATWVGAGGGVMGDRSGAPSAPMTGT